MARHADDTRNRGVAGWIIGSSIAGVVLVAALIAYFVFLRNDASDGADTGCSGSSTVQVVAGASAPALSQIADAYNATRPAARGVCVSVQVSALPSSDAADALLAGWTNEAVPPPAIWVADTGADVTAVESGAAELVAGHSETVWASSPVVLAVSHLEADSVPADLAWAGLPAATDSDNGVTLAGDRRLSLALGDPRTDLGTAFALESVVGSGSADAAVQPDQVTSAAGALSTLAGQSARTADVAGLLDDVSAGSGTFTALPVLEAQIAVYNAADGNDSLRAVYPAGPTVSAELLPIALTAPWLDRTQVDAATTFLSYLRSAPAVTAVQDAGWRIPTGTPPAAADGIDRTVSVTAQPAAGADVREAMAVAIGLPANSVGPASATSDQPPTTTTETSSDAPLPDPTAETATDTTSDSTTSQSSSETSSTSSSAG